ncbi:MAG: c-type cytochrome [Chloroflexota bacterium]
MTKSRHRTHPAVISFALMAGIISTFGRPQAAQAQTGDGQAIYDQRCAVCHGENGDGAGPGADLMFPRPRDFTSGAFKIRTTTSDSPPTDEDLIRVISQGMPGTTMPAWGNVLSNDEMAAVAQYVKSFTDIFEDEAQPVLVGDRVRADAESIARGAEVYRQVQCFKCHGDEGRGDGPSALTLTDEFDQVIYPADLSQAWFFRGGGTAEDIYLRIMGGMIGSPMPSFADALLDEQMRWDLVNYVDSLSPDTLPELPPAVVAHRVEGAIPDDPKADAWQTASQAYYPLAGQIMVEPRNFTPSITGVWLRALYNGRELALLVQWSDRQENTGQDGQPADAMAVQFPAALPEGDERPYFVFGDNSHPVNLWTWTAGAGAAVEQNGRGLATLEPQATQNVQATAAYANGRYSVIFRRALNTGDREDITFSPGVFVPIAFAASDGLRGEQPGSGALSSWQQLYLEQPASPTRIIWIPVAMAGIGLLEGLTLWLTRRQKAGPSHTNET